MMNVMMVVLIAVGVVLTVLEVQRLRIVATIATDVAIEVPWTAVLRKLTNSAPLERHIIKLILTPRPPAH